MLLFGAVYVVLLVWDVDTISWVPSFGCWSMPEDDMVTRKAVIPWQRQWRIAVSDIQRKNYVT